MGLLNELRCTLCRLRCCIRLEIGWTGLDWAGSIMGPRVPTACFAAGYNWNESRHNEYRCECAASAFGDDWVPSGVRPRKTVKIGGQTAQGPAETSARSLSGCSCAFSCCA